MISADGNDQKLAAECTEFSQMMVNGSGNVVTVKGICRQIMINGDGNRITADAALEYVFNGGGNVLKYSRFVNGKPPSVIENMKGNVAENVSNHGHGAK